MKAAVSSLSFQESFFNYLFGVSEPGCYGLLEVSSGKATLFVAHLPEEYAVWMGKLLTCNDFKNKYDIDEVYFVDEVSIFLHSSMLFFSHEKSF